MLANLIVLKWLELSISASVIAIILLLVRRFAHKLIHPRVMYGLWFIVLVKLAVPFNLPSPISFENWTDVYFYQQPYSVNGALTAAADGWNRIREAWGGNDTGSAGGNVRKIYIDGKETVVANEIRDSELIRERRDNDGMTEVLTGALILWLGGSLIYAGVRWFRGRGANRLFRKAIPCEDREMLELLQRCKQEAGVSGAIRIRLSGTVFPVLYGMFRPRILLPYDYDAIYTKEELRFILLHELRHYKHGDIAVNRAAGLLQALHWFNPILHLAMRTMRKDMELNCDASVLRRLNKAEAIQYGMLLIKQGELNRGHAVYPGSVAPWLAGRSSLAERIQQIAKPSTSRRRGLQTLAGVCIFAILCAFFLPSNNIYAERKAYIEEKPTMYAFWLNERVNPQSMVAIRSMADQMTGASGPSPDVALLMKASIGQRPIQRMIALLEPDRPMAVGTERIRNEVRARGIETGHILVMVRSNYAYTKYFTFGIAKSMLLDLSTLEIRDRINVY